MAKKKLGIFSYSDFRGGYATNLEKLEDNELITGKNCYWNGWIEQRPGIASYASLVTNSFTTTALRGIHRVYVNDAWHDIVAADDGSEVRFFAGTTTTTVYASLTKADGSTNFSFTTGKDVEFAHLGDETIAVNGTDRPAVIFATSSALYTMPLDQYDERVRDNDNWKGGQFSAGSYVDDTTDAQDTGGSDFIIASATSISTGAYFAGDFTYSKLIFSGVDAPASGPATGTWQYFNASETWANIGTFNATPTWATGTNTLEFELPMSTDGTLKWAQYTSSDANLTNRYCVRSVWGAGATNQITCDYVEQSHTHYLTQIMGDQKPETIKTHKNHVFMSAGNQVQISVANRIKSIDFGKRAWRADRWEYFFEGGNKIIAMETLNDFLAIVKEGMIFGLYGTSWENWSTRPITEGGAYAKRGVVSAANILWMLDRDAVYAFDGTRRIRVSRHIQSALDAEIATDACSVYWNGLVMFGFPTTGGVYVFDPDTFRRDDMGEGRVSFFLWNALTSYKPSQFIYRNGASDDGKLIFYQGAKLYTGDESAGCDLASGTATINMEFRTKLFDFGNDQYIKNYKRVKPKVGDVDGIATTDDAIYTFKMMTEDEDGGVSHTATLTAGSGTGIHQEDITVPYTIDGKMISFYVGQDTQFKGKVYSFAVDVAQRRY